MFHVEQFCAKPSPGRPVLFHVEQFSDAHAARSHCLNGLVLVPALVPGSKDIVELLLLRADFFLLVEIFLLDPHLGQHFAAFVRILVALALRIALLLCHLQRRKHRLLLFQGRVQLFLNFAHSIGWYRLLQLFLARCGRLLHFLGELLDAPLHARDLELDSLQRKFFAPLDAFADTKNRSQSKSESHGDDLAGAQRAFLLSRQSDELLFGLRVA